jgi:hypothetical protein
MSWKTGAVWKGSGPGLCPRTVHVLVWNLWRKRRTSVSRSSCSAHLVSRHDRNMPVRKWERKKDRKRKVKNEWKKERRNRKDKRNTEGKKEIGVVRRKGGKREEREGKEKEDRRQWKKWDNGRGRKEHGGSLGLSLVCFSSVQLALHPLTSTRIKVTGAWSCSLRQVPTLRIWSPFA